MQQVTGNIIIGEYEFRYFNSIDIQSSFNTITDQAIIKLPRKVRFEGENIVLGENSILKRGDEVQIDLGYNYSNTTRFKGFVEDIKADTLLTIICTDTYPYKLKNVSKSYKSTTLKEILSDNVTSNLMVTDFEFEKFRIENNTPLKVLDFLKKEYLVKSWFREGKLYSGFAFDTSLQQEHQFILNGLEANVIDSDNLIYYNEDDIKLKVKATSILKDNTKIEVEIGDEDGEQRTLTYYNIKSKNTLQKIAEEDLKNLKYSGYRGSFETFAFPHVYHGDIVELVDKKYSERSGKYIVENVNTTFSMTSAIKQKITLSEKV